MPERSRPGHAVKKAPIILDEATANVAPENGKKLMDAIEVMTP